MGVRRMKQYFVEHFGADAKFLNDIGMEGKGLEYSQYVSKVSCAARWLCHDQQGCTARRGLAYIYGYG